MENQYDDFVKVMQDSAVNDCLFFIRLTFSKISRTRAFEILVPLSIMGVWKNDQKSIVDECKSHVIPFVQALSLELPALAINFVYRNDEG